MSSLARWHSSIHLLSPHVLGIFFGFDCFFALAHAHALCTHASTHPLFSLSSLPLSAYPPDTYGLPPPVLRTLHTASTRSCCSLLVAGVLIRCCRLCFRFAVRPLVSICTVRACPVLRARLRRPITRIDARVFSWLGNPPNRPLQNSGTRVLTRSPVHLLASIPGSMLDIKWTHLTLAVDAPNICRD